MTKKISNDIKSLKETFILIGGDKKTIALSLIDEAFFMEQTLSKLKESVNKNVVEDFKQGKQEFTRENPALKSYNTTIKNYQSIMKQINDLLPDDSKSKAGEDILKFNATSDDE